MMQGAILQLLVDDLKPKFELNPKSKPPSLPQLEDVEDILK